MNRNLALGSVLFLSLNVANQAQGENVATRWLGHALDTVRAVNASTPAAGRAYAMVTVAMYDAVNGIERERHQSDREPALVPSEGAPPQGLRGPAAAAAAHGVLTALFPSRAPVLDAALLKELEAMGGADNPASRAGQEWGELVAAEVVSLRSNDGTQIAETKDPGFEPGQFPRPFTGAQFRQMSPFGVNSPAPYASPGPPPLGSGEYAADFNEVKVLGNISDGDAERAAISRHWQAEANTARETGLWLKAALTIVENQGTAHSLSSTVRLFALLGMAIADSITASWTDKFDYHFWRPQDAIRNAELDGNPATEKDASWAPRNSSPGGTPEHTSGTSTIAGAAATVLAGFYCQDDIAFSFAGELGTPPRSYSSFSQAADEAGRSRIFNGIHFEFSNRRGTEAGVGIGAEIVTTRLRREGPCHGIHCVCPQM